MNANLNKIKESGIKINHFLAVAILVVLVSISNLLLGFFISGQRENKSSIAEKLKNFFGAKAHAQCWTVPPSGCVSGCDGCDGGGGGGGGSSSSSSSY